MEVKNDPKPELIGPLDQPLQVEYPALGIRSRRFRKRIFRPRLEHPVADRNPEVADSGSGEFLQILFSVELVPMPVFKKVGSTGTVVECPLYS